MTLQNEADFDDVTNYISGFSGNNQAWVGLQKNPWYWSDSSKIYSYFVIQFYFCEHIYHNLFSFIEEQIISSHWF